MTIHPHHERVHEEIHTLAHALEDPRRGMGGGGLTFLVWHLANIVDLVTEGRYRLAVLHDNEEVEPIEMKYDRSIRRVDP